MAKFMIFSKIYCLVVLIQQYIRKTTTSSKLCHAFLSDKVSNLSDFKKSYLETIKQFINDQDQCMIIRDIFLETFKIIN